MQFLNGHHYVDAGTAADKNLHRKALGAVGILLLERTDLVKQFFSKPSLETADVDKMIALVYTECRDNETSGRDTHKKTVLKVAIAPSLNCRVKEEDMVLLAECANQASFFKEIVNAATISDLLHCRLATPLVADNLMGFAYFLDRLSAMHLVGRNWQTTLERCGFILQQGENKPQGHASYASALSRARRSGCFRGVDVIDATIAHISKKNQ